MFKILVKYIPPQFVRKSFPDTGYLFFPWCSRDRGWTQLIATRVSSICTCWSKTIRSFLLAQWKHTKSRREFDESTEPKRLSCSQMSQNPWKSLENLFKVVLNDIPSHFSQAFQFMVLKSLFYSWLWCFFSDDLCIFWAFFCQEAGEERYVLDAIIGEGMKSTEGGIGVENLQGSGLIAGETSRAYQDARGSRVAESFHLLHFDFVLGSCKLMSIHYTLCP